MSEGKTVNHWPVERFEHNTEGTECQCEPVLEAIEGGVVVIHNRMDRPDKGEKWQKKET